MCQDLRSASLDRLMGNGFHESWIFPQEKSNFKYGFPSSPVQKHGAPNPYRTPAQPKSQQLNEPQPENPHGDNRNQRREAVVICCPQDTRQSKTPEPNQRNIDAAEGKNAPPPERRGKAAEASQRPRRANTSD